MERKSPGPGRNHVADKVHGGQAGFPPQYLRVKNTICDCFISGQESRPDLSVVDILDEDLAVVLSP